VVRAEIHPGRNQVRGDDNHRATSAQQKSLSDLVPGQILSYGFIAGMVSHQKGRKTPFLNSWEGLLG